MASQPTSGIDRRSLPRLPSVGIEVGLRPKGRLTRLSARALDFNRFGIAVCTDEPLKQHRTVYVSLRCGTVRLDNLPGVVHNCTPQDGEFRSGIRFRTHDQLATDRQALEHSLLRLEVAVGEVAERGDCGVAGEVLLPG
ncbi:MAG: hypothetical protein R3E86_02535 [Pseudomonadales bacterium]